MATEITPRFGDDTVNDAILSLDLDDVRHVADLGAQAPEFAIRLHQRYGCVIHVIGLDENGARVDTARPETDAYLKHLISAGVGRDAIKLVTGENAISACDVVLSLNGYGVRFGVRKAKRFFDVLLHSGSRVIAEIHKGSGAYPFFNAYGSCATVVPVEKESNGLVVVSVEPNDQAAGDWSSVARSIMGDGGFFDDLGAHSFLHISRGDTLVVTFDNLDIAMTKRDDRRPWGFEFIRAQGWSMLAVMSSGWTWFRSKDVVDRFTELRDAGFFSQFERVVFYGASMGGYAAAAYAAVCPNSTVFAISPQSTLNRDLVPWETRYKRAWSLDFTGDFGDAAAASRSIQQVNILFDPYVELDAAHAARFTGANVALWRCPLMGHRLGSSLAQMGVLGDISRKIILGDLSRLEFYNLLRKRHGFSRFQRELANLALSKGHPDLAAKVCTYALRQQEEPYFRRMLDRLSRPATGA